MATGSVQDVINSQNSITGKFLSGKEKIEVPASRREPKGFLEVKGAKEHNLKKVNVKVPLGEFTAVTGVSGSSKSSFVNGVIYPYLSNELNRSKLEIGKFDEIKNANLLDKVILIDQAPIGRTPRSNPATYTGLFTPILEIFASTQDAKERVYSSVRFSVNVKVGRL